MLTETFQSIASAARNLSRNWQPMLLIAIVYACLLVVLYFFVSVREASLAQVVLTFALAIAAPLLFFVLQAMIAGAAASDADELTSGALVRRALTSFWKLLLITLPLIALAVLIAYLLGKAQARFGTTLNNPAVDLPRRVANAANAREAARSIDWRAAILSTVRYLFFGLILPLAAIHLWLATAQEGLGPAIKKLKTLLARAFAPQSVLIYVVGFVIFAVIPYFLLFKTIPTKHAWLEISLLVARLAVVFALSLFGWVMTVKAISLLSKSALSTSQPHPANEAL
jgi:hypothetical protein